MSKAIQTETPTEGQFIELDPKLIEADPKKNARFALIPDRIQKLAKEITDAGGVMQPIEVTPLESPINGFHYRLTFGNYRLAAVNALNKEGAGLTIPAIVKKTKDGLDSTMRNLMENIARQDLTSMDMAHDIKLLLDGGVPRMRVREIFARPNRPGPASNSWINITMSFLDLPKAIQTKLHTGQYSWDAGATLVKVHRDHPEQLDEVLAEIDVDRQKAIDKETKEEEKLLNLERKAQVAANKEKEAEEKIQKEANERATKLQTAKDAVAKANVDNEDLINKATEALKLASAKVTEDPSAHAEVAKAAKHLEATQRTAVRAKEQAEKALARIEAKIKEEDEADKQALKDEKEAAKAAKAESDAAKRAAKPGGVAAKKATEKPTTAADVKKAAATKGVPTGVKVLNRTDIMAVVNELSLPGGAGKAEQRVSAIGQALKQCFNSAITTNQLVKELLKICKG